MTTLVDGAVNVSRSATGPVTRPTITSTRLSRGTNWAQFGRVATSMSTVSSRAVPWRARRTPPSGVPEEGRRSPAAQTRASRPEIRSPWLVQTRPASMTARYESEVAPTWVFE
ncbi:MAG TPA: hypothetical protein VF657_17005 [Actinoplanes sp.]